MNRHIKKVCRSVWECTCDLIFPHVCAGCGSNLLTAQEGICANCLHHFPTTGFLQQPGNAIEKIFWGRIRVCHAGACCYFSKKSGVQQLMHNIKYHYRADAGFQLGQWMGYQLLSSPWFSAIDLLIPMPLHKKRLAERGYNQAGLLCSGISDITGKEINDTCVERLAATSSQTKQHRYERWENMRSVFGVREERQLMGKHVLLVDDVITTGATLEAMGEKLLEVPGLMLSVCCFAYTTKQG